MIGVKVKKEGVAHAETHIEGIRSEKLWQLLAALKQHGPITTADLAQKTKFTREYVSNTIGHIRSYRPGAIRIAGWLPPIRNKCKPRAEFEFGGDPDAVAVEFFAVAAAAKPEKVKPKPVRVRLSPRPVIPESRLPPLAWLAIQPAPQMSARW